MAIIPCRLVELEQEILNQLQDPTILGKLMEKKTTETKLNQVRVVGHLMHVAPAPWCDRLADALASAEWGTTMLQIADFYINNLFRLLRTDHHRTPANTSRPSRQSFDNKRREIELQLEHPPSSHREAKERALMRDGYRCVLNGNIDADSLLESMAAGQPIAPAADPQVCLTRCCHIFSRTVNANIDVDKAKREYAASARAVLDRMAPDLKGVIEELHGAGINRLENVMTMDVALHACFYRMDIWLESEDAENTNTYRICVQDGMKNSWYGIPETITFSTPDAERLPVPAHRYLVLHGVCARVAHLSGAAEYVLDILDRVESGTTAVLTEDGSDAHVLERMLAAADIAAYVPCDYLVPSHTTPPRPPKLVYGWRIGYEKLMEIARQYFPDTIIACTGPALLGIVDEETYPFPIESFAERNENYTMTLTGPFSSSAVRKYLGIPADGPRYIVAKHLYASRRDPAPSLTVGTNYLGVIEDEQIEKLRALTAHSRSRYEKLAEPPRRLFVLVQEIEKENTAVAAAQAAAAAAEGEPVRSE
ncbi:hypothetical protein C8Q80DRAFT_1271036 [Daedaleopsis nitida]|nr:hypothetical protein C8Q80DRAFT_1271036 [Daedaleopsis nitida]